MINNQDGHGGTPMLVAQGTIDACLQRRVGEGQAHLPPGLAGLLTHRSMKIGKLRQHTHAGGGQLEPVLGGKANLDYIKPHSFTFELLT